MNTKQIPFRYPEELEEDFKEIADEVSTWSKNVKNQALQRAVKNSARLIRLAKKFKNIENRWTSIVSANDLLNILEELTKKKKEISIDDIKIQGHKK